MATLTNVIMPQMGESIVEATITGWRKKVGEEVAAGEALLDISTAKVEVEIPSPAAGVLAEIKFPPGATVPIDTVIAAIAPRGTVISAAPAAAAPAASAAASGAGAATGVAAPPATAVASPAATAPATNGHGASVEDTRAALLRTRSTPLVRNMAREHGIDLARVPGTGSHGRVTRRDLEQYLATGATRPAPAAPPAAPVKAAPAPAPAPITFGDSGEEVRPLSVMRRQIAEHMVRSKHTSPHAYTVFEVDFTRLMKERARARKAFEERYGAKLTPLAYILAALAATLPRFPALNATLRGNDLVYRKAINIGVAVAIPTGLIVPVIHGAENMSLAGIARALQDNADRARAGRLLPADIEGGTFTVTSPGQLGAVLATPIINQPQAAILHVGAITKTPAVIETPEGDDVIVVRQRAMLTLGFDHRIIDGWDADSFMAALRDHLEATPPSAE